MSNLVLSPLKTQPCRIETLYREVHDRIDFVFVTVKAINTGDNHFGRIYVMNAYAHDGGSDTKIHESLEALQVTEDADAQRIGIGLFDSLMQELGAVSNEPEDAEGDGLASESWEQYQHIRQRYATPTRSSDQRKL